MIPGCFRRNKGETDEEDDSDTKEGCLQDEEEIAFELYDNIGERGSYQGAEHKQDGVEVVFSNQLIFHFGIADKLEMVHAGVVIIDHLLDV